MSDHAAAIITAIATAVLAFFAIATAILAYMAFRKQSQEVRAIERQVADAQDLTRQQGELIQIQGYQAEVLGEQLSAQLATAENTRAFQSDQVAVLQAQLESQRKATEKQAEVLDLQADELRESLAERKRQAETAHRTQAAGVFLTEEPYAGRTARNVEAYGEFIGIGTRPPSIAATAHNTSSQPIYDVELWWHRGSAGHGDPNPEPIGTLLPGDTRSSKREFPEDTRMEVNGAVLRFRDAAGIRWMRRPDGDLTEQELTGCP